MSDNTVVWIYILLLLLCIAFWGTVGYIALHFVSKYW